MIQGLWDISNSSARNPGSRCFRQRTKALGRSVFLVRRYDPELDTFLGPLLQRVETEATARSRLFGRRSIWKDRGAHLSAHIRQSAVTLVDIDPSRFNVGLETGYALALGRPVMVIMDKAVGTTVPFDIATLHLPVRSVRSSRTRQKARGENRVGFGY
jgi:hypothetical protein